MQGRQRLILRIKWKKEKISISKIRVLKEYKLPQQTRNRRSTLKSMGINWLILNGIKWSWRLHNSLGLVDVEKFTISFFWYAILAIKNSICSLVITFRDGKFLQLTSVTSVRATSTQFSSMTGEKRSKTSHITMPQGKWWSTWTEQCVLIIEEGLHRL